MICRFCGYEFDENSLENRGCSDCGRHNCSQVHCPNCGMGNHPEFEKEFEFITKLKDRFKNIGKSSN